jgi:hypothetical protein
MLSRLRASIPRLQQLTKQFQPASITPAVSKAFATVVNMSDAPDHSKCRAFPVLGNSYIGHMALPFVPSVCERRGCMESESGANSLQ